MNIKKFLKERDAALLSGDLDKVMAFYKKWNGLVAPAVPARDIVEIGMHKAITGATSLPMTARQKSRQWLLEKGYKALDDGDVPV